MKDAAFVADVLDRLEGLGDVTARPMFGGHGVYHRGQIFAVIDDGRLYFKVDDALREEFTKAGSGPFEYAPGKVISSYYEVPLDVFEETPVLVATARRAAMAAAASKAAKKKPAKARAKKA